MPPSDDDARKFSTEQTIFASSVSGAAYPGADEGAPEARSAERFVHEGEVGRGGMGAVFKVFDRDLRRTVAMKVLSPEAEQSIDSMRRFVEEARITGQLDHPNLVPVHELGLTPEGRPYFVMKLVEGRTLWNEIHDGEQYPWVDGRIDDLLAVFLKVCDAVAFAHSRGVIHRDIKPQNIMVGAYGQVYLMDWGVAQTQRERDVARATHVHLPPSGTRSAGASTDSLVGTPAYMAPEQALGQVDGIDPRTDVFMLGGVLYEMLVRKPPYEGENLWQVIFQAIQGTVRTPEERLPDARMPKGLSRIAMKAMARDPAQRYQSVAEMRRDVERYLRGTDRFQTRVYAPGERIVVEGEPGDCAFIITAGKCVAYKTVMGTRMVLREMTAGEVFGETAVFTARSRTATVEAVDETTVMVVTRESIGEQLGANAWLGAFVRALAQRFREIDERLTEFEHGRISRPDH